MPTYTGNANADYIGPYTGVGAYTVNGGNGGDTIEGYTSGDRLNGEAGADVIYGYFGNDTIDGGTGNDTIFGEEANDMIYGQDGNDYLDGGNNADTIYGGGGNDYIVGDYGSEYGQDVLYGGTGNDTIEGGADSDIYRFVFNADGKDLIYDSAGDYDKLDIDGVANIAALEIHLATVVGGSANDVIIYTDADAADGTLSEYILVKDYFTSGQVEFLEVNGTEYWFSDYIV